MVNRRIGARALRPRQPVLAKLTPADVAKLKEQGHSVIEFPDGRVEVAGSMFRLTSHRRAVDPGSVSVIEADPLFGKDVSGTGRNELTDFA